MEPTLRMKFVTYLALAILVACPGPSSDAAEPGPPVLCFGDSITKRGYPEVLADLLGVKVVNAGIGGNTTVGGLRRIDTALLKQKPRVVVILFGTNDSRVDAPEVYVEVDRYAANLAKIIDRCEGSGARTVLCTPPPVDEAAYFGRHVKARFDAVGGLAKLKADYRAAVLQLSTVRGIPLVDLDALLANETSWRSTDGVHPTPSGCATIAKLVAEKVAPLLK